MKVLKIGAMVNAVNFGFTQSKRLGGYFFLHCHIDFEQKNLITKYSFTSLLSTHSAKYGHNIRYTN